MRVEEEEAQKASLAQERKDRARAEKEWRNADDDKVNGQFKKLYFLLDQSKVRLDKSNSCKPFSNSSAKRHIESRYSRASCRRICRRKN